MRLSLRYWLGLPSSEGLPGAGGPPPGWLTHMAGRLMPVSRQKASVSHYMELSTGLLVSSRHGSWYAPDWSKRVKDRNNKAFLWPSLRCHTSLNFLLVTQASPTQCERGLHKSTNEYQEVEIIGAVLDAGFHWAQEFKYCFCCTTASS